MTTNYINKSGLYKHFIQPQALEKVVKEQEIRLQRLYQDIQQQPLEDFEVDKLYVYQAPKFIGNACSLDNGTEPYDLIKVLKGKNEQHTRYLAFLNAAVHQVFDNTKVGWIGIYKKFGLEAGNTLVKMAYRGLESRAEFPLYLPDFQSNNKEVGLTGQVILINDIESYLQEGGEYYECDISVKSELCLPIFNQDGTEIIGIVDAEDHQKYFFYHQKSLEIIALCINLSKFL